MDDPLAIYLHDHLAGSSFAMELLEKLAGEFAGTPSGDVASKLLDEVRTDRKPLEQLIAKVGTPNQNLYDALGWVAERLSRIKLRHDDPIGLGAFEAFETLSLGILGKRGLWEVLRVRQSADTRVAPPIMTFSLAALRSSFTRPINIAWNYPKGHWTKRRAVS